MRGRGLRMRESDLFAPPTADATPEDVAAMRSAESPEDLLASQFRMRRMPEFARQYLFAKAALGRLWKFDFAFVEYKVAVEVEGVVPIRVKALRKKNAHGKLCPAQLNWTQDGVPRTEFGFLEELWVVLGRHSSIGGIEEDMVKYNAAAELGWIVVRVLPKNIKPGHAVDTAIRVLAARGWRGSA